MKKSAAAMTWAWDSMKARQDVAVQAQVAIRCASVFARWWIARRRCPSLAELRHDGWAARTSLLGVGPLCRDEVAVPGQDGVGGDDRGQPSEQSPTESLALGRQAAALVVGQSELAAAKLLLEDSVRFEEVVDLALQVLVHPAGEGRKDEAEEHEVAKHEGILGLFATSRELLLPEAFEIRTVRDPATSSLHTLYGLTSRGRVFRLR